MTSQAAYNKGLYKLLAEHLTERKRELFDHVAFNRTRHIAIVLEDIYQAQNASAIFRSMESSGIQDAYTIENSNSLSLHRRIAKGSYDWLTLHKFAEEANNTIACFNALHAQGYKIYGTTLSTSSITPDEVDIHEKIAVVMGTELSGISEEAKSLCDGFIKIPMYGFTESLNVSVAAGVIMQRLVQRLRSTTINWHISEQEQTTLKIEWAKKAIYWNEHLIEMYEKGELK